MYTQKGLVFVELLSVMVVATIAVYNFTFVLQSLAEK